MARQDKAPQPATARNTLRAGDIVQPTIPNPLEFDGGSGASLFIEASRGERIAEIKPEHEKDALLMAKLNHAIETGVLVKV